MYWILYALCRSMAWNHLDLTHYSYYVVVNVFYLICFKLVGVVAFNRSVRTEHILAKVVGIVFDHCLIMIFLSYVGGILGVTWKILLVYYVFLFIFLLLERLLLRDLFHHLRIQKKDAVNVVIIGDGKNLQEIASLMEIPLYGCNLMGVFSDKEITGFPPTAKRLGSVTDALKWLEAHQQQHIGELYCGLSSDHIDDILPLIDYCERNVIRFYSVPNFQNYLRRNMVTEMFNDIVVLSIRQEPLANTAKRITKRIFDIIVSGLFLCTLYPFIYIFVGLAIKLSSKGPVYFKQDRNGLEGKIFKCIKFRSMKINEECDTIQAQKDDPRKTRVGDFLRRTNIDELPQFINVFKGDMSLVGPRPHMLKHTQEYSRVIDRYMVRHFVKPGITGWAQVNGFRGETKELSEMVCRIDADIWYIEHWTFWLDIRIIIKTIKNMLHGEEKAY
ncbi:MAG: undecaprenyl-phosphate glucose phosphotransferase [Porphyromonadaceae bacterium]|nr:undecaprenyl-phosphate glucose phosphotransferase [Porphyromonadaceae bacterium]